VTAAHAVYLHKEHGVPGVEVTSPGARQDWYPVVFAPSVARAMARRGPEWRPVAVEIRAKLAFAALAESAGAR
jgi:hypothetical protein